MIFGIVGLVLLLNQAIAANADILSITSLSIYGGSMILLYLASTLYHAIPFERAKRALKTFDHCAIYLLIAGTYTPFPADLASDTTGYQSDGGDLGELPWLALF